MNAREWVEPDSPLSGPRREKAAIPEKDDVSGMQVLEMKQMRLAPEPDT